MRRILSSSRYLIGFAVVGAFVAAVLLLVFGMVYEMRVILTTPLDELTSKNMKTMVISLIEIIDIFLLGTGFYLIALGLYELFIDDSLPVPDWLEIHNFDDLKNKLVSIIIVVLSVTFLSQTLRWEGGQDLLGYGIAIGLVIAALTYFISVKGKKAAIYAEKNETEA
jgi:uncharacterized membrane protein YqhA